MKRDMMAALALLGLASGCGSSRHDFVTGQPAAGAASDSFTITEPSLNLSVGDEQVSAVELEGFDADGKVVYPPTVRALNTTMLFDGFPSNVARVQVDYLRNGGFLLLRAEEPLSPGQRRLDNPSEVAVSSHRAEFAVAESSDGFELVRTVRGASIPSHEPENSVAGQQTDKAYTGPLTLKGVCYSPAPIGFSNQHGPAVGDLFWDTFIEPIKKTTIYNWYGLWGTGALGDTGYYARDDLKEIRALGCNSIRVYAMTSRQLEHDPNDEKGAVPAPGTGTHFQHKMFLDQCWNNGNKPLHVLVGIPMPDVCFRADIAAKPNEIAFWEHVLTELVEDTKDHPAVLGYVIMNEHDSEPATFPRDTTIPQNAPYSPGEPNELTEYFYGQTAKYADQIKAAAPGKLVGWALHDVPEFVQFASVRPSTGPTYMEQLKSFDFWGVNTYHNDSLDAIFGSNYPGNYANLPTNVKKPLIFTEFGWPATTHKNGKLYEDAATHQKVADTVSLRFPEALSNPLLMGTYYFEFQDEWWKQGSGTISTWDPTNAPPNNFPNGYWDEEGFGLFSAAVTSPRKPTDPPFPENGAGPVLPLDRLTPRMPIVEALRAVYTDPRFK